MIVRHRPNAFRMLFILQGSILPQIMPQLLIVIGLSALLSGFGHWLNPHLTNVPLAAFSLIGLTLSIFLGFRNNACYDRWWEARKLWGSLIAQMRHLCRDCNVLPEQSRTHMLRLLIAFSHVLKNQLRQQSLSEYTNPSWLTDLSQHEQQHILQQRYPAQYILNLIHQELMSCLKQQQLSDICYTQINQHIIEISNIQAGCERISNTPLPFAYSLLLHRTAYLFCLLLPFALGNSLGYLSPIVVGILAYTFFGLDVLGNELEEPFGLLSNDLALDAMVRVIEIDILTALGSPDIPKPLTPIDYVLT
jgi:putative membrane protein